MLGGSGGTAAIERSVIVGAKSRDIASFEYVGAVPDIETEEVFIIGLAGATDNTDNVLGLNVGNVSVVTNNDGAGISFGKLKVLLPIAF